MDQNVQQSQSGLINGELEVAADARFEARWRWVEMAGRIIMVLAVIGGISGALGAGPLDHARAGVPSTPEGAVDYEPVGRFGTTTQVTVHLPPALHDGTQDLVIGSNFIEPFGLHQMFPQPVRQAATDGGIRLTVPVAASHDNLIRLYGKPAQIGPITLTVQIAGEPQLRFREVVLP